MAEIPDDIFDASVKPNTAGQSVLIMTANDVEDSEFFYPYYRLIEEGFRVDVITPKGGKFEGKHGTGLKNSKQLGEVDLGAYDMLYIPGGKAPAELKDYQQAIDIASRFAESGKPIAAFCHGPHVLAAADVIQGKRIAAWPKVEDEVREAGAQYINQPTVVDGQFITGRWPGDLPSFTAKLLQMLRGEESTRYRSSGQIPVAGAGV